MYLCICNGIKDSDIQSALEAGAKTVRDLNQCLDVGSCCGKCVRGARDMVRKHNANISPSMAASK